MSKKPKTDRRKWSEFELEILRSSIGHWPLRLAVQRYQKLRWYHGLPIRTPRAIKTKANKMGWSCRNNLDNMSISAWGRALGLHKETIRRWDKKYKIGVDSLGRTACIPTSKMKAFAEEHPRKFARCDPEALEYFFGKKLASQIQKLEPFKIVPRPVRCNRTGNVYSSLAEAGRHNHSSPGRIRREAQRDGDFSFL